MKSLFAFVPVLLVAVGCTQVPNDEHKGEASREQEGQYDCREVGNVPGAHLCAVTYVQLLAHPERYDGKRIRVLAWAQPGGRGRVVLFPSKGSVESGEDVASIVIEDDPQIGSIERFLASGNVDGRAVPIYVSGTFVLTGIPDRSIDASRHIRRIEDFGP
ncbi:hypothetical protein [Marilutibacter spongiae]|uniref:Lipoprotein n=1 Tax=Marilutibacter spongiae TaxID=2025720 RepID=A0A7W3Y6X1_9GAMM|nr:hypothetical protein [Lysobacter spongiae]MBB1061948.1 hypothetical protein [Lysobacter spongiae]